jgi:hypothetical protein
VFATTDSGCGVATDETTFRYAKQDDVITASYEVPIRRRFLVGSGDSLDFRHVQLHTDGSPASGHCSTELEPTHHTAPLGAPSTGCEAAILLASGRIAQRESARFTRGRSLVRSQVRPSQEPHETAAFSVNDRRAARIPALPGRFWKERAANGD